MGKYPLELGNYILILVGIALILSGPYFSYRTVLDIKKRQAGGGGIKPMQWGSFALNFLIAIAFFFAGILFVVNNLRGNPMA